MNMNTNLPQYYAQRAAHYDDIYRQPERQDDLEDLGERVQELLIGKKVLEVACGTGYWTEKIAGLADSIVATDINPVMLELAQNKLANLGLPGIHFELANSLALPSGDFDACLAGFWWSHVPRAEQSPFLDGIRHSCGSGTLLVMFDNCEVEGETLPIARTDLEGNTFQIRRLPDGSRHEVLKNYPTDSALRKKLAVHARDIRLVRNDNFWLLTAILR